jgi:hypothetical protein
VCSMQSMLYCVSGMEGAVKDAIGVGGKRGGGREYQGMIYEEI